MKIRFSWQKASLLVAALGGALVLVILCARLGSNYPSETTDLFKAIARSDASDEALKQQITDDLVHHAGQESTSVGGLLRASYFSSVKCSKKVGDCYLMEIKRDIVKTRQIFVSVTQSGNGPVGIEVSVKTID